MCPEVDSASENEYQVKAAGAFGWRPTTLVVPKVEKIRGPNLPGTPRATSACRGIPLLYFTLLSWRERETLNHQRACVIFLRQQRNLLPILWICRHQQVLDSSDLSYGVQNLMYFYFEQATLHRWPHSLEWALENFGNALIEADSALVDVVFHIRKKWILSYHFCWIRFQEIIHKVFKS